MKACRFLFAPALVLAAASWASADEALNKLLAAHEQSVRSARLPLHRKLLGELQKLESQYQKGPNKLALAEVQAEIVKVKQLTAEAAQPVGSGAGPQPSDFRLVYFNGQGGFFGSWENGELKVQPQGFSWTNKNTAAADVMYTRILRDAFEVEISYKGNLYSCLAAEAEYTRYIHYMVHPPADDGKHTIKFKRTAGGAVSAELDGKPFTLTATEGARQDMHMRIGFRILKDATVEFRDITFKDQGAKK